MTSVNFTPQISIRNNMQKMLACMRQSAQLLSLVRGTPTRTLNVRPFSSTTQRLSDNIKKGTLNSDIHSTVRTVNPAQKIKMNC